MKNEFAKVMSERTDEALIKIITTERKKYNPIAIEAAEAEVQKRTLDIPEFEKIQKKAVIEKKKIYT